MCSVLCSESTVIEKYEFIESQKTDEKKYAYPVEFMCKLVAVSKSGFYEWRNRPESETARRRELLEIKIRGLFEANNEEYGYRRVHRALARGGEDCCQPSWRGAGGAGYEGGSEGRRRMTVGSGAS